MMTRWCLGVLMLSISCEEKEEPPLIEEETEPIDADGNGVEEADDYDDNNATAYPSVVFGLVELL